MDGHGMLQMLDNCYLILKLLIEPEDEKEPLPAIGGARFYTWMKCHEFLNPRTRPRGGQRTTTLDSNRPEAGIELPPAPLGQPPKRKIEGSVALPQPLAEEVQRHAEMGINEIKKNLPKL